MFGAALDRIGGRLGLPNTWERRTRKAVLEAYDILRQPGPSEILVASAHLYEPALVHQPSGWKVVFPRKARERELTWFKSQNDDLMLQAGALRQGVWLQTRISGPTGVLPLQEAFAVEASTAIDQAQDVTDVVRRPPGEDGTPGEVGLSFRRNGAPLRARMLVLSIKAHLIQVFYEAPVRLADAAHARADEAVAIGLDSAHPPEIPPSSPEELAEAMRGFGMSEVEVAEALRDPDLQRL